MALRAKSLSKTFVWILLAMLIVGLAGFGATNLGGTVRTIGTVGNKSIDLQQYARGLQNEINAVSAQAGQAISFADAQAAGIDQRVLSQLITARALDNETAEMGISVGDETLRDQLLETSAFQGVDGSFDREAYRFALQNAGMSEAEYETTVREETARTLLQGAIVSGNTMPSTYVDTLVAFAGERRSGTWARLTEDDLTAEIETPDDAALRAYYDENIARYTLPEQRRITYAWVTPEMMLDEVEVDESLLEQAYVERDAEFNQPERRLVERLPFADEAAATEANAQITSGETSFEDIVEARGLDLADVDLGDVAKSELDDAADAVFAAEVGQVVGPFPSSLGPALFRVNAVLPEQATSFEEARELLIDDLALDQARRLIAAQGSAIDDQLAGGATLEEIADETLMTLGTIDWAPGSDEDIAAYDAFREVAQTVQTSDFPEVAELGDGGLFAMRLDDVLAPRPEEFEVVRDRVEQGWETREITQVLAEQAEELQNQLQESRSFESAGLQANVEADLLRSGFVQGAPIALVSTLFEMEPGQVRVIEGAGSVALLRLDAITPADTASEEATALANRLSDQAVGGISQDLFQALANDIQGRAGVSLNQQALNAVHTQFQ